MAARRPGEPRPSLTLAGVLGALAAAPRRRMFGLTVVAALACVVAVVALVLVRPHAQSRPTTSPVATPAPVTITQVAEQAGQAVEQVARALPVPVPTPDPLAVCQHDPANLPPAGSGTTLHTCGARILTADGQPARITGISWFGMETGTYAPHGLWTRNWKAMLDQVTALGFNTIRLPFSNEALVPGRMPQGINYDVNPELAGKTSLEIMDTLVQGAAERGLKVILDRHRPTSEAQSELWYTDRVPEERWIADWVMLAQRYRGQSAVIGVDLHNEPRGPATWGSSDPATDWRPAAQRAGNAILNVNPYLLIFVQGVERSGDDWYWWGGSLQDARTAPIQLDVPGRLVYSPHDYGPGVYPQPWFNVPEFPDNLPAVWDAHWGYLAKEQIAPVVLGEFGGRSVGSDADGAWQRALLDYAQHNGIGWLNWSFNPNSGDTGGLLSDDWLSVVESKAQLYRDYLAAPLDVGSSGAFGRTADRLVVRGRSSNTADQTNNLGYIVQIANGGSAPADLAGLELRYWFKPGPLGTRTQQITIDYAAVGGNNIVAEIGPADASGVAVARLRFTPAAGAIQPYTSSGDIVVRIHKSDWSTYDQRANYSFKPDTTLSDWDHVGLYRAGQLVWGSEPPAATPRPSAAKAR